MAIKLYKPTSPARRKTSVVSSSDITKKKPEKKLTKSTKSKAGRNNSGKITVRHRGGGAKRKLRKVDFKRNKKFNITATVLAIEYDPSRSARIALVQYQDGELAYVLAHSKMKVGDKILSSDSQIEIQAGNRMPLSFMQSGMSVYNVELEPSKGGVVVRSAGSYATIQAIEGKYAQLKMPSGEVRLFNKKCLATIGQVSNPDHRLVRIGKAGRKRHMGIRPTVRGKAMNPVDHPHGGGEGRQPIGLKYPKTAQGKHALGVKTRRKKWSDKYILRKRKKKKKK